MTYKHRERFSEDRLVVVINEKAQTLMSAMMLL